MQGAEAVLTYDTRCKLGFQKVKCRQLCRHADTMQRLHNILELFTNQ